jgi:hypothetical protein
MWRIRMFFRTVKNMFRWFPIIWKDEDWDDHFIFEIFKFKLKNQAKYIGNRDFHTRAKRDAEIMNLCVRLMEKIQNDYYSTEHLDFEETSFELVPIPNSENYEMKSTYISDTLNDYFNKYPLIYNKVVTKYNLVDDNHVVKYRIAMYMSRINHDRARKLLFKLMEQNIERWWN